MRFAKQLKTKDLASLKILEKSQIWEETYKN